MARVVAARWGQGCNDESGVGTLASHGMVAGLQRLLIFLEEKSGNQMEKRGAKVDSWGWRLAECIEPPDECALRVGDGQQRRRNAAHCRHRQAQLELRRCVGVPPARRSVLVAHV